MKACAHAHLAVPPGTRLCASLLISLEGSVGRRAGHLAACEKEHGELSITPKECGICMENVYDKPDARFGLMSTPGTDVRWRRAAGRSDARTPFLWIACFSLRALLLPRVHSQVADARVGQHGGVARVSVLPHHHLLCRAVGAVARERRRKDRRRPGLQGKIEVRDCDERAQSARFRSSN